MGTTRAFGTVRKLPSGRYQARYWHLGKQIAAPTTFTTKRDARVWLSSVETDLQRGTHVEPILGTTRFGTYARQWIDQRPLRPRTVETYESQLKRILSTFENAALADITPSDVRAWHGKLSKSGLSRNTVAKTYRLFRTIMSTAVEDGLLRVNPVGIKGASAERIAERPLLTWDDVEKIASAIEPRFSALVWIAAVSGLRFGELTALDRERVNLFDGTLRVDRALSTMKGEGPRIGPPKSDAAHRVVAIPPQAREILRAHCDVYVEDRSDALVFTALGGGPLINNYFVTHWRQAKADAGVDAGIRFHDLRHLAGTTAATAGASLREIMARMGHASAAASLRYLKAAEARDREIATAIGAHLEQASGLNGASSPD